MKTVIYILIIGGLGLIGYKLYQYGNNIKSKDEAIRYLLKEGKGTTPKMNGMDSDFLIAYANAHKKSLTEFNLNGKTYLTSNGTVKK